MGLFTKTGRKVSRPSTINEPNVYSSSASTSSSLKSPTGSTNGKISRLHPNFSMSSPSNTPSTVPPPAMPKVSLPKAPDPRVDPVAYLRSIGAVRERCSLVSAKAQRNELNHFEVDMSKFDDTTNFVVSIIKRDFAPDYSAIPPHGRWQHFNVGGRDRIGHLLASWPTSVDSSERCRRLLDLFLVSVLLDAGAGTAWSYKSKETQRVYRRSEGLAVASLEMFRAGMFSGDDAQPHQVDARGLRRLTVESMAKGLQVSEANPMSGLEGRASLLIKLAEALSNPEYFGPEARPGAMLDYLLCHPSTQASSVPIVPLPTLWSVLVNGLAPIWPASRTTVDGIPIGDAWPLSSMPAGAHTQPWETIVPFHKLTQWLCYSLMQPMARVMQMQFAGAELMTGLPEYRNGGLFVDTGVLTLGAEETERGLRNFREHARSEGRTGVEVVPMFEPEDDVVVEWRAVTVGFLDLLLESVNGRLGLLGEGEGLTLPQMLEAGSWKGGRELAEVSRPNTKEPPIMILSDGTVF